MKRAITFVKTDTYTYRFTQLINVLLSDDFMKWLATSQTQQKELVAVLNCLIQNQNSIVAVTSPLNETIDSQFEKLHGLQKRLENALTMQKNDQGPLQVDSASSPPSPEQKRDEERNKHKQATDNLYNELNLILSEFDLLHK